MLWEMEIGSAYRVQEELARLDKEGIWPYHIPNVAATDSDIERAEKSLGESFPSIYREFLKAANGWIAFYQTVDLFSTMDFEGSCRFVKAQNLLVSLENLETVCGIPSDQVFPIAVSQDSIDVFLMARSNSLEPGSVFWVAGQLVDAFNDFAEFFLSMVAYNREEIEDFISQ